MVTLLLDRGADVNVIDKVRTLLDMFYSHGCGFVVLSVLLVARMPRLGLSVA